MSSLVPSTSSSATSSSAVATAGVQQLVDINRQLAVFFESSNNSSSSSITANPGQPKTSLEKFVRGYSALAKNYDRSCPLVHFWLLNVAPSCVYPMRLGNEPLFYECCICSAPIHQQVHLIRHYREQHHSELPANIFGTLDVFRCRLCDVRFTRRENLQKHFTSILHMQVMSERGSKSAIERFEALNDARRNWRMAKAAEERAQFDREQQEYARLTNINFTVAKRPIATLVEVDENGDEDVPDNGGEKTGEKVDEPMKKMLRLDNTADDYAARKCHELGLVPTVDQAMTTVVSNESSVKTNCDEEVKAAVDALVEPPVSAGVSTASSGNNDEVNLLASSLAKSASLMENMAEKANEEEKEEAQSA